MRTVIPNRVYISLGSHAPLLSTKGARASLEAILSDGLKLSRVWPNIRFMTTLAVNPANIPTKFGPQALMRNNDVIKARNQILHELVPTKVIDIWSLSFAGGPIMFRANDAVHFVDEVYFAIGKVIFTELLRLTY